LREIDHFRTSLPPLLRQVVVKAAGEGEEERNGMAGEVLVVAAAHIGDGDVVLDQCVVEPGAAEPGSRGADPAQLED
jgi:hypothetical protein